MSFFHFKTDRNHGWLMVQFVGTFFVSVYLQCDYTRVASFHAIGLRFWHPLCHLFTTKLPALWFLCEPWAIEASFPWIWFAEVNQYFNEVGRQFTILSKMLSPEVYWKILSIFSANHPVDPFFSPHGCHRPKLKEDLRFGSCDAKKTQWLYGKKSGTSS